jgi:hypothetical protein
MMGIVGSCKTYLYTSCVAPAAVIFGCIPLLFRLGLSIGTLPFLFVVVTGNDRRHNKRRRDLETVEYSQTRGRKFCFVTQPVLQPI